MGLYQYLALEIMIWMLFALGYNLLLGHAGLPSFGHGAYFGIGAYAFGLLQQHAVRPTCGSTWPARCSCAALLGRAGRAFISHRRGIYYALLTIAFGQVFWFVAIKWHSVTGGEDGLLNIKRLPAGTRLRDASTSQSNEALFYFALALFALVLVALWRLVHSPFGRVLQRDQAERDARRLRRLQRLAVQVAGLHASRPAWRAWRARCSRMAQQSAYPNVMSLHNSGFVVMMVLIGGGLVSFWGPVIGALFFILARDLLGAYTETWLLWYGLVFMAMVLFKPEGVAGHVAGVARASQAASRCQPAPVAPRKEADMALFEATRPAQALRRPGGAGGHHRWRSRKASWPASWAPTAPARPPASTC